jgi:hypothetical protein
MYRNLREEWPPHLEISPFLCIKKLLCCLKSEPCICMSVAGHLTFECRNFVKVDPLRDAVHLDVSSTSSEDSEEDAKNRVSVSSTSSPSSSDEGEARRNKRKRMQCTQKHSGPYREGGIHTFSP